MPSKSSDLNQTRRQHSAVKLHIEQIEQKCMATAYTDEMSKSELRVPAFKDLPLRQVIGPLNTVYRFPFFTRNEQQKANEIDLPMISHRCKTFNTERGINSSARTDSSGEESTIGEDSHYDNQCTISRTFIKNNYEVTLECASPETMVLVNDNYANIRKSNCFNAFPDLIVIPSRNQSVDLDRCPTILYRVFKCSTLKRYSLPNLNMLVCIILSFISQFNV
ncbi:hypothetical protein GJ496_000178 [Pomphorhynchus laevis]|nr:hypothetical protein GJ496_000178 [Pomphorhynchus laevis]